MIQLTCANCRNTLEVDDAFAGGVCRCQFCGTIQTVPKPGSRPRSPGAAGSAGRQSAGSEEPKALYQVKARAGTSSAPSGLEELAEVVHSSGLSGSGLLNRSTRNLTTATPAQRKQSNRITIIAAVSGFAAVSLLVILGFFIFSGKGTPADRTATDGGNSTDVTVPGTPSFHTVELAGDRIVYVIDRGDATAPYFAALKKLTLRSVRSLGGDRKFAVILWNNGSDDAFPQAGAAFANREELDKLSRWFDEVATGRATTVQSAMSNAMTQSPDEIVLMTAKSDQLEGSDFAATVLKLRTDKKVKINTVTLGESPAADPLKTIAQESNGKFINIKRDELPSLSD